MKDLVSGVIYVTKMQYISVIFFTSGDIILLYLNFKMKYQVQTSL